VRALSAVLDAPGFDDPAGLRHRYELVLFKRVLRNLPLKVCATSRERLLREKADTPACDSPASLLVAGEHRCADSRTDVSLP
jgi:hypothetical protein